VDANKNELCPLPWHVPTTADFIALDKAFGGSGENRSSNLTWIDKHYINMWGGEWNGCAAGSGMAFLNRMHYWSATAEASSSYGSFFMIWEDFSPYPQRSDSKTYGFSVRCVK
jgi:uncharacterized protein (TIGR02145 family)